MYERAVTSADGPGLTGDITVEPTANGGGRRTVRPSTRVFGPDRTQQCVRALLRELYRCVVCAPA
jgi:hypothetical protein